ncbi:MAG TPA: ATP-binding protein [Methylomirabilota bacterium]|nr:ATP-binding protein [Methylomirabilota bacterium]
MRFGFRSKETLAISLLTLLVVATTTAVHLSQLTRVVVEEAARQARLVAQQIYAQSGQALERSPGRDPRDVLRRDRDLRSLLDASVGYSPHLLYALITDRTGKILLHTERQREGVSSPARRSLDELLELDPLSRLLALYGGGETYEAVLSIKLNDQPFGSIRLGVSATLLRRELNGALRQTLALAGLALALAWVAAMALARLVLRPIRALTAELDRLRRGEFDVGGGVIGGGDEFQELASQLQGLGRELQADRMATLSEKARLQHVVNQLEDGVIFLNAERRVLFFNHAAESLVGRPLEQVVGTPLGELLAADHPIRPLVDQAFAAGGGARNATLVLPLDGRSKEFLVSVVFMRDANRVMGAAILLKDLESVKTVQSLVSYSAKLAALGRLTSGVAHEVKNPLNAMMIHLEVLKERLDDPNPEVQQSLEVIGSEIRRLDRVVQGFLRFMRPQELVIKPVDLNGLLQSLGALVEAEWQSQGVRMVFDLDGALPPVGADEELLRQAFLNILQNAGQAMPHGGTVTLRTAREGRDSARVEIADEGVGIPPEDLDKVFKLYYTTKPDGSGIGLSVVYRIVQLHDGTIDVQSQPGRGTVVTVRLPLR